MFDDAHSRWAAGVVTADFIERELEHALAGMNTRNAADIIVAALSIVDKSDFSPEQVDLALSISPTSLPSRWRLGANGSRRGESRSWARRQRAWPDALIAVVTHYRASAGPARVAPVAGRAATSRTETC